ncbi:MAG: LptF/LptG family permease [Natronospirillum sp.]
MNLITRYVLFRTLKSIAVVFLIFSSLLGLLGYADELARRGSESFSSYHVMIFTLMELPSELYSYFFPFIVMVGTLVSVGGLAASSELTAIRATGMSISRLLVTILFPAVVAIGALFAMGEVLAPALKLEANAYRAERLDQQQNLSFANWYQSGAQMIRVGSFAASDDARGLFLVDLNENDEIVRTVQAQQADIGDDVWVLNEVTSVTWEGTARENLNFQRSFTPSISVAAPLSAELIYNLASSTAVLTLPELWLRVNFLQERAVLDDVVALEFWSRLTAPLLTLALSLVGIAFVFGSIRSMSMGLRIALGVGLALVLQIAQQFIGPIGLYLGLSAGLSVVLPVLLVLLLGAVLLRRNS